MKSIKTYFLLTALMAVVFHQQSFSQKRKFAKQSIQSFQYEVTKLKKDSTKLAGPAGIELRIPHNQFDSPEKVNVCLVEPNGNLAFSYQLTQELLTGATIDTTGVFEFKKRDFVFNVNGVPAKKYKVALYVFGEDGQAYFVHKDENWWEDKKDKGTSKGNTKAKG